ncbi:protein-L-isoaspartate(D-aspartate) O-methyltransferase [Candidatus Profftia tarda]|uniref:Protein-L-isoaspartate O-methyltransferase n=1 Tax=Candidatus Profftia tarda TaxID=1177216 RepID=A0A8E4F007_9ENTR|nr:protein-L-isoaspartate(D-aspartate) O-methyltransferase [Candidatus Profftia tarda]CAD6509775.1 Protein-L-isoaspartate O-methyltransferase [Candidatus Profftia tarda]
MVEKRALNLLQQLIQQGIGDEQVLEALGKVPREKFIDEAMSHKAYDNIALPIGSGQTISQPYIVARMTELLRIGHNSKVLEIGTGSGYQTAVLAHLAKQVFSVERIKNLQWQAKRRLKQLDLYNISTRHGDGWQGWATHGLFDAIIVTAAPPEIPGTLLEQLRDGGRLVLPMGDYDKDQNLNYVQRRGNDFFIKFIEKVRFVPLVRGKLA